MHAEQLTGPIAYHGEGPVWSARWGGLRWVDMLAGDVLTLARDGSVERRHVDTIAAAVRPRTGGGAVLGIERGFALEDPDGTILRLPPLWDGDDLRMNEGGCDPSGRFYCGSMAYDRTQGVASLFRLDPDRCVHRILDAVTTSNGIDWSPAGDLAYYVDTATRRIDVFDDDADGLTNRRPFVAIAPEAGRPDGLTVDAEGGVWVALHRGGAVHRYSPTGVLDAVIELPTPKVTACTFGGDDLDVLFITTSREGMEPGEDALAGSLFRAEPGARGRPVREFAG